MTRKPHGMMMAPPSGGGGSGGGNEDPTPVRPHRPSDGFVPVSKEPMEVILNARMMRKIFLWVMGPLLAFLLTSASLLIYFYHSANAHMGNEYIHLGNREREKLETKEEAVDARKKLRKVLSAHIDMKMREVKVEQKEMLQQATKKIQTQQQDHYRNMLREIRKAQ